MEDLKRILAEHPLFKDLIPEHLEAIVGCASNVRFDAGQFLFREGQDANQFFLIRHGKVSLEIYTPSRGPLTIQTIDAGNVLGWSWLFPPYRWHFDARALELTRAIAMDGKCLREKKEHDFALGYNLMERFSRVMEERLTATRLQLADVYNNPGSDDKFRK